MLPTELLSSIAANLTRADICSLQMVNVVCRDLVARDFAIEPRLYVKRLRIFRISSSARRYIFDSKRKTLADCTDDQEFIRRMKHCVVTRLAFNERTTVDQPLMGVLRTVSAAWAHGTVDAPRLYANKAAFVAAFGEVFHCKRLLLKPFDHPHFHAAPSVFALGAVRHCEALDTHAYQTLDPKEVCDWLHRTPEGGTQKTLLLRGWTHVVPIVAGLKKAFHEDTAPHPYRAELTGHLMGGMSEVSDYNERTNEFLLVRATGHGEMIIAERKLLE
ncbi:hypothetical protein AAVH_18189 [Aphelenchoides avenae]|nr:hypothetical protein AAVH_18189 [Aphelenchus avenae]